jgi:predicted membrane metal-binding protein
MPLAHEDLKREHAAKLSSERSFGLVVAAAFAIVALGPLLRHHSLRAWALYPAALFVVLGIALPKSLAPLNRLWFKLGLLLNRMVSPVVLFVLFFAVFTPMGLLLRIFRKNLLGLRRVESTASYWIPRAQPAPLGASLKNQF